MSISNYLCHVVGEPPTKMARAHPSTVKRAKAFALAIHIPVLTWAVTGYLIAAEIFKLGMLQSLAVSMFCAGLIYLVERLVIATPKTWYVNVARVLIGFIIAVLGASAVDLVIFDREINQQLAQTGEARMIGEHDQKITNQGALVAQKKEDWEKAQAAANCEANGTCGSKVRSVGPVYRALARQVTILREDYVAAEAQLAQLKATKVNALAEFRASPNVAEKAGLLARIEALHTYTASNTAAFVAWLFLFALVLFFELMVVLSKLVFGETVDDEIERAREQISLHDARIYLDAMTSPVKAARELIDASLT